MLKGCVGDVEAPWDCRSPLSGRTFLVIAHPFPRRSPIASFYALGLRGPWKWGTKGEAGLGGGEKVGKMGAGAPLVTSLWSHWRPPVDFADRPERARFLLCPDIIPARSLGLCVATPPALAAVPASCAAGSWVSGARW